MRESISYRDFGKPLPNAREYAYLLDDGSYVYQGLKGDLRVPCPGGSRNGFDYSSHFLG